MVMVFANQVAGLYIGPNCRPKSYILSYLPQLAYAMKHFHSPSACIPYTPWYTEGVSREVFLWAKVFTVFSHALPPNHGDYLIPMPTTVIGSLQVDFSQIESRLIEVYFYRC